MSSSSSSLSSKRGDGEEAVRHAEKNRPATCLFADRLARLSVDKMQKVRAAISCGAQVPCQNVMAAVIMYLKPTPQEVEEELNLIHGGDADKLLSRRLVVVSLGLGTKYLNSSVIMAEESRNKRSTGGLRVRDCHAEVLARRGFKRYLYSEILKLLDDDADGRGGGRYAQSNKFFALDDKKKLIIKPDVEFHLYTSSQPCGNAAIKKWVTSKSEQFQADIPAYAYPSRQPCGHQAVQVMAMHEGQASFLKKKSFGNMIITNRNDFQDEVAEEVVINGKNGNRGVGVRRSSSITFTVGSVESNMDFMSDIDALDSSLYSKFIVPEGCRPCRGFLSQRIVDDKNSVTGENIALHSSSSSSSSFSSSSSSLPSSSSSSVCVSTDGILMTCSDKILQWNVMGLQGGLILSLLSSSLSSSVHSCSDTGGVDYGPLTVPPIITCKSIIVGRKFSQQTALRGLCCRFENAADNRKKRRTNDKMNQFCSENDLQESADICLESANKSAIPVNQSASYSSLPQSPLFTINHPLIMGTSIKFDESAIVTGVRPSENGESKASGGGSCFKDAKEQSDAVETGLRSTGALFLDFNCICWWEDSSDLSTQSLDTFKYTMHCEGGKCCVIDGRSGFLASTTMSESISPCEVSSAAFFSLYKKVLMLTQRESGPLRGDVSYSSVKNSGLSGLYSAEKWKLFAFNNNNDDGSSSSSSSSCGGGDDGCTSRNELSDGRSKEMIARSALKGTKLGYWIGTKSLLNFVDNCSKRLSDES